MTTTEEVNKIMKRQWNAILNNIEANQAVEDAEKKKMAAHYELLKAQDEVRSIKYN